MAETEVFCGFTVVIFYDLFMVYCYYHVLNRIQKPSSRTKNFSGERVLGPQAAGWHLCPRDQSEES